MSFPGSNEIQEKTRPKSNEIQESRDPRERENDVVQRSRARVMAEDQGAVEFKKKWKTPRRGEGETLMLTHNITRKNWTG